MTTAFSRSPRYGGPIRVEPLQLAPGQFSGVLDELADGRPGDVVDVRTGPADPPRLTVARQVLSTPTAAGAGRRPVSERHRCVRSLSLRNAILP